MRNYFQGWGFGIRDPGREKWNVESETRIADGCFEIRSSLAVSRDL